MIKLMVTNIVNNQKEEFIVKDVKWGTTGKLSRNPYQGEAFQENVGIITVGSQMFGTLICNYHNGEVTYKNNGIEAVMKNLKCERLIY